MDTANQGLEGRLEPLLHCVWRQNADLLKIKNKPFTQNSLQTPMKTEFVFHRRYTTWHEAKREIVDYIEIFYNRRRLLNFTNILNAGK